VHIIKSLQPAAVLSYRVARGEAHVMYFWNMLGAPDAGTWHIGTSKDKLTCLLACLLSPSLSLK
jgi:hypothetical protein